MQKYSLEFAVGLFVLVGVLCLGYLTIKLGKMEVFSRNGYFITANFGSITGLKVGASVEIAGVPVGKVASISLNDMHQAAVTLQINNSVGISTDSTASIKTSGLIGDKYVNIQSGGAETDISPGGILSDTRSALDIESLIGKFAFGDAQ